jgi:mono/diheme cytochrome c family protein
MQKAKRAALSCGLITAAVWLGFADIAIPQAGSIARGRQFARANCERCHSIDKVTPSRLPLAPPFRSLGQRYPIESLEEALAEGISTAHQNMPEFRLEPDQIGDFIAFLKSLQPAR